MLYILSVFAFILPYTPTLSLVSRAIFKVLDCGFFVSYSGVDHKNYNIAKFTEKLLREGSGYRIDNQLGGDIEYLYTFEFEDNYEHGEHYNRVKLKSIKVNQDVGFGRGGKRKFKTLSEFQDAINEERKVA